MFIVLWLGMLGMFAIPQIYRRSLTHKFQEVSAMAPTAISSHRSSVSCGLQLGKSPKKMGGFSSNHVWWLQVVTCTFPARGVQVWARGIQELVLPIACFRTWGYRNLYVGPCMAVNLMSACNRVSFNFWILSPKPRPDSRYGMSKK